MIRVVPFRLTMFLSLGERRAFSTPMGITAAPHSTARMSSSAISYTSCPLVRGIDLQAIQRGSGANWWEAGASVVLSLSYLALLSPPTLGVSITRRTGRIFQQIGRT